MPSGINVTVIINDLIVFDLFTGDYCSNTPSLMCGKDQLPVVTEAITNALSFCEIESLRLNDANRMSNIASPSSEVNCNIPVSVVGDI